MDLFFILFFIFIAIMVVGYLGRGIAGKVGCLFDIHYHLHRVVCRRIT